MLKIWGNEPRERARGGKPRVATWPARVGGRGPHGKGAFCSRGPHAPPRGADVAPPSQFPPQTHALLEDFMKCLADLKADLQSFKKKEISAASTFVVISPEVMAYLDEMRADIKVEAEKCSDEMAQNEGVEATAVVPKKGRTKVSSSRNHGMKTRNAK
ncbi:hypothetical protein LWI29_030486 [Acer saccharum]|uniref:Uncharacterized protein n=1 Tax=Acer saccharum TaxID=4024 RepID=A0AA39TX07_ACESA|nr:hypothetical protein LWI29_030486 [Acer saccharum]